MRGARLAAGVAGLALVTASLMAAAPASAQSLSFTNPLATAITTDIDITSLDVDYTDSTISITAHTQNASGDFNFAVVAASTSGLMLTSPGAVAWGGEIVGSTVTLQSATYTNGTFTAGSADGVALSRNAAAGTVTATISTSVAALGDQIWVASTINETGGGTVGTAGQSFTGSDFTGLGPVLKGSPATTTTLALHWPSQAHNGTPVVAKATVTPASATGVVQFFDNGQPLGSVPVAAGRADLTLPSALATGAHSITATFVPTAGNSYVTSASAAVPLTVLSSAKATTTTVSLSKATQKFKKTPVKLTVKVSGKPAGTVVIRDGKNTLKTVALKAGTAKYTFSKKLKKGSHKITATFVPADTEAFAPSTSKSSTLKVK